MSPGAVIVPGVVKPNFGFADGLVRLNTRVTFGVYTVRQPTHSDTYPIASLWKTDGTPQGTQVLKLGLGLVPSNASHADDDSQFVSGNSVFLSGNNGFLWKTDGTLRRTVDRVCIALPYPLTKAVCPVGTCVFGLGIQ